MARGLWERLRAARSAWLLAALALLALFVLLLPKGAAPTAGSTPLEARLERILSPIVPNGGVRAMIREDDEGNVIGAVIVAEGLDNVATGLELERAAMTLLNIDATQVEIIGGPWAGGEGWAGE